MENGETVVGIDNLNDYYDVRLKCARLKQLETFPDFQFIKIDIADKTALNELFEKNLFSLVCNLAAQAGVMYSVINPNAYIHSNISGFLNILECCKEHRCKLIYASSGSVYGGNTKLPFSETDTLLMPRNLYAKTKINNEYLAQIYSEYFDLEAIGVRFFSVYGAFGRPDMAYMLFTKWILNGLAVTIYGNGHSKRDYTFIDDVIAAIEKIIDYLSENKSNNEIFNIGNSVPVSLLQLLESLEKELGIKAVKNFLPARSQEIEITFADTAKLEKMINYKPQTSFDCGIKKFVEWYQSDENPIK
ncbi:NAD-dependent epimerase [Bacteroidia bacterium]|nr:NAD-dependent epimerase [Bacteroidia bacterium]